MSVLKFDRISFLMSASTLSRISVFKDSITDSLALLTDTRAFAKRAFDIKFLHAVHIHTKCEFARIEANAPSAMPEHRMQTVDEQNAPHFTESPVISFAHFSQVIAILCKLATLSRYVYVVS